MTSTPATIVSTPTNHSPDLAATQDLSECGWRYETVTQADGTTTEIMVPLTEEDFLHPQEDDHFPSDTFHDLAVRTLHDILSRRYSHDPSIGIYGNLIIDWQRDDVTYSRR